MYIVTRELWALVHRRMLAILGRRQIATQVRTAGDETASERTSSRRRASSFFLRSRPANDRTSLRTSFVLPCECHHQTRKFPRGVRGLLDTHEVDLGEQIPELDLHILDHPADVGDVARLALKRLAVELRLGGESTHTSINSDSPLRRGNGTAAARTCRVRLPASSTFPPFPSTAASPEVRRSMTVEVSLYDAVRPRSAASKTWIESQDPRVGAGSSDEPERELSEGGGKLRMKVIDKDPS